MCARLFKLPSNKSTLVKKLFQSTKILLGKICRIEKCLETFYFYLLPLVAKLFYLSVVLHSIHTVFCMINCFSDLADLFFSSFFRLLFSQAVDMV